LTVTTNKSREDQSAIRSNLNLVRSRSEGLLYNNAVGIYTANRPVVVSLHQSIAIYHHLANIKTQ